MKIALEMVALKQNLLTLVDSIEECLSKRRILPCLMLLYSAIDIVSSLETGEAKRPIFIAWVDKYLLKSGSLDCTAIDLYGARCGILHTFSSKSHLSRQGQAREIVYAWGNARGADLALVGREIGRNDCVVHVRELIDAFRDALAAYLEEVMQSESRMRKLYAGAGLWLMHLDQKIVTAFIALQSHASAR